jgi:thioredoxin reductase (NADPH)
MSNWIWVALLYLSPMAILVLFYLIRRHRRQKLSLSTLEESVEAGLTEPASLHPVVDPLLCIGCGSCVSACPEKGVLGLIRHKAVLVNPTSCIGHGACEASCPENAITLVFGTERRGVDIPEVSPDFESGVPGIFIAGELGGMGLIRNATEQGRQAMESIEKRIRADGVNGPDLDCVIVGAGPAGLSATLSAMEKGLNTITIDQESVGGTVAHFPRGKLVMTSPAVLPIVGKVPFKEVSREELLSYWQNIIEEQGVQIRDGEALVDVQPLDSGGFEVATSTQRYTTRTLLLAIGRRGTPRKLGVPGEDSVKVTYRLVDPKQYDGDQVLVVGGGDSALEAACSVAEESDAEVWLSYRSDAFQRAKKKNRDRVDSLNSSGRLTILFSSNVIRVDKTSVLIGRSGGEITIPNTAIIVCAGGVLPTPFLKKIGIQVTTKYGTA